MTEPWIPYRGYIMKGLCPGVMVDQRKALADTTELTDTVYFVHPTGIRTLRTMVREVTRGLETGEYQGLHNENLPGGWRKVSMDESEHREVTRRLILLAGERGGGTPPPMLQKITMRVRTNIFLLLSNKCKLKII